LGSTTSKQNNVGAAAPMMPSYTCPHHLTYDAFSLEKISYFVGVPLLVFVTIELKKRNVQRSAKFVDEK